MNIQTKHGPDHVAHATDEAVFADWPAHIRAELEGGRDNGCVGSVLVSETERVRVWHLHIPPGGRCGFHRHVNPYFWSSLADGRARNYFSSGEVRECGHYVGETKHFYYGPGDYMMHSVENIGDTTLSFVTVEFLDGTNAPLEIPAETRLVVPDTA